MCTVSFIGHEWSRTAPDRYPNIYPPQPYIPPVPEVTRAEFDALRLEMQELRKLLLAAKEFDAATGQPDCEMEEKVGLIKRMAELVGVDMTEVFEA